MRGQRQGERGRDAKKKEKLIMKLNADNWK
jgi:hypothetical protein